MYRRKKRAITLLEIMIVIFLIGLIGSVIGYNVKGSLEEGKAFRTEQAKLQIQDILSLEASYGTSLEEIVVDPGYYLKKSGLCKDYKKLLKDGWGQPYAITLSKLGTSIKIHSVALEKHKTKKLGNRPPKVEDKDGEDEEAE